MEWFSVIGLIVLGIGLIIIEVIFVPGTTIVGIGGFICGGFGIYLAYTYFGTSTGTIVLIAGTSVGIGSLIYSFKSRAWERFSLKDENQGRYNDDFKVALSVGDQGETISSLKPIGKAIFNEKEVEVRSNGNWIDENQSVRIVRIDSNKIIVEPI